MSFANQVLLADPDADLSVVVAFTLRQAGLQVHSVYDGGAALRVLETGSPDVLVLDASMPDVRGVEICRQVRERFALPILMLIARDREEDLLIAFASGADDCISKPLRMRTLVARVKALLRRADPQYSDAAGSGIFSLDLDEHTLHTADGKAVLLTPLELKAMHMLTAAGGRTVPTEKLLLRLWGKVSATERRTLKQLIYRLRNKLAQETGFTNALQTTPGSGYRLVAENAVAQPDDKSWRTQ